MRRINRREDSTSRCAQRLPGFGTTANQKGREIEHPGVARPGRQRIRQKNPPVVPTGSANHRRKPNEQSYRVSVGACGILISIGSWRSKGGICGRFTPLQVNSHAQRRRIQMDANERDLSAGGIRLCMAAPIVRTLTASNENLH
jgi:hypothetical protein